MCEIEINHKIVASNAHNCNLSTFLTSKISNDLKHTYLIMIFLSKERENRFEFDYNQLILGISQKKLTIVTEYSKIHTHPEEIFNRQTSTYIILSNIDDGLQEINSIINKLENHGWYTLRPKCLMVYFHDTDNGLVLRELFESVAYSAWVHKFYDFSVISIDVRKKCSTAVLYYINSFTRTYKEKFISEETVIFPDKLIEANGYKLFALAHPSISNDKNGNLYSSLSVDNHMIPLISIALKRANLSIGLRTLYSEQKIISESRKYYRSRVNIFLRPAYLSAHDINAPVIKPTDDCLKIVAVVPLLPDRQSIKVENILAYMCTVFIIIITVLCGQKLVSNSRKFWNALNLTGIFMGMPSEIPPRTQIEKIFFICFMFIAMKYSAEFYSDIVEIKFMHKAVPFDTFKDIINSNLTIYGHHFLMRLIDENDDPDVEIIKRKVIRSNKAEAEHIMFCLASLITFRKKIICLTLESEARNYDTDVSTVAKPVFACPV